MKAILLFALILTVPGAFAAMCGDAPMTRNLVQSRGAVLFFGELRYGINTPPWSGDCPPFQNGLMFRYHPESRGVVFFECVGGQVKYEIDNSGVDCR